MDAYELPLVEPRFHGGDSVADEMRLPARMDAHVLAFRFDPVDVAHGDEQHFVAFAYGEKRGRGFFRTPAALLRALDRLIEAPAVERLERVIDGRDDENPQPVL